MNDSVKIRYVQTMCGESDEETISAYLEIAKQKILALAFPFGARGRDLPERYEHIQLEAAVYLLNKRGAEGETVHNENGINRTYEDADLPASMLRAIVPYCGVME